VLVFKTCVCVRGQQHVNCWCIADVVCNHPHCHLTRTHTGA
jgi:hypothetical protein